MMTCKLCGKTHTSAVCPGPWIIQLDHGVPGTAMQIPPIQYHMTTDGAIPEGATLSIPPWVTPVSLPLPCYHCGKPSGDARWSISHDPWCVPACDACTLLTEAEFFAVSTSLEVTPREVEPAIKVGQKIHYPGHEIDGAEIIAVSDGVPMDSETEPLKCHLCRAQLDAITACWLRGYGYLCEPCYDKSQPVAVVEEQVKNWDENLGAMAEEAIAAEGGYSKCPKCGAFVGIKPLDKPDMVNHPPHYTHGSVECVDAMEAALGFEGFQAYCRGVIIKYSWRVEHKGAAVQDLEKIAWYANRAAASRRKHEEKS